jgi:hypothetical protein
MTNHPNRKAPGWVITPVTPAELRALIEAAAITQADAARRCYASDRTMRQWLAEPGTPAHRHMPLTASETLALSLMWPGESRRVQPTLALVERWLRPQFAGLIVSFP